MFCDDFLPDRTLVVRKIVQKIVVETRNKKNLTNGPFKTIILASAYPFFFFFYFFHPVFK